MGAGAASNCLRLPARRAAGRRQQFAERYTGCEIVSTPLLFETAIRVTHPVGMRLPGHNRTVGTRSPLLNVLLSPADFVEPLVADAEMVANLVEDGAPNLLLERRFRSPHRKM